MTKSKKSIFIALEFIVGLTFGLIGAYIFSLFNKWDLYFTVLFTFISIYVSTLIGVGLVGFYYLKQIDRTADFGLSMFWSFMVLIIFLFLYFILISLAFKFIPYYLSSVLLPIILPIIGVVIGFNSVKKLNNQTEKNIGKTYFRM